MHVYFAKNVLQYFRYFVKGFAKMSMTKQNLGFPLDVQNRTEVCKITNLNRINTKIIKIRVAINMPFWILFLILKLCKITEFAFVFLWKNFRFQIFMKSPLKINITKKVSFFCPKTERKSCEIFVLKNS